MWIMVIKTASNGASLLSLLARERARDRYWRRYDKDTHACCGCGDTDVPLDVHHRDRDYLNNNPINLMALCHRCHKHTHGMERVSERLSKMESDFGELVA